jgi:hypothetical protein
MGSRGPSLTDRYSRSRQREPKTVTWRLKASRSGSRQAQLERRRREAASGAADRRLGCASGSSPPCRSEVLGGGRWRSVGGAIAAHAHGRAPQDALPGRGSVDIRLTDSLALANGTETCDRLYARKYPVSCLEQQTFDRRRSPAIPRAWDEARGGHARLMSMARGSLRFWPSGVACEGSIALTAYIALAIAAEAGLPDSRRRSGSNA